MGYSSSILYESYAIDEGILQRVVISVTSRLLLLLLLSSRSITGVPLAAIFPARRAEVNHIHSLTHTTLIGCWPSEVMAAEETPGNYRLNHTAGPPNGESGHSVLV
ncbi:hypothetical protein ASPCADRAFT_211639, partial [Aspergillus carbonarius ITEM 5010]